MSKKIAKVLYVVHIILIFMLYVGLTTYLVLQKQSCYVLAALHFCVVYAYLRGRSDGMNKIEKFYSSFFTSVSLIEEKNLDNEDCEE